MAYLGTKPANAVLTSEQIGDGVITQADLSTGVAGTGPAFNAYLNSVQLVSNAVNTKVTFDAENFDTNNNFASSRFTPTVAGYYQINATVTWTAAGSSTNLIYIFKNGSEFARGARIQGVVGDFVGLCASTVVYLNGSTDYVEIYAFTNGGVATFEAGQPTIFSGSLVRSA
jgi:hypothetical protein